MSASAAERFDRKVAVAENGCWDWVGTLSQGYGRFYVGARRTVMAHRWSYERHVGPVPDGLVLDHLCRNTRCVNPAHLEAVTQRVNTLRGQTLPALNLAKTHCPKGHEYRTRKSDRSSGVARFCLVCHKERAALRRAKIKAARPPRFCLQCGVDISERYALARYCGQPCKSRAEYLRGLASCRPLSSVREQRPSRRALPT